MWGPTLLGPGACRTLLYWSLSRGEYEYTHDGNGNSNGSVGACAAAGAKHRLPGHRVDNYFRVFDE